MRYITTQEFLKLDDANKARTLKEIAQGEVRLKEGDLKEDTCLLFKIIEHIEQNSKLKIHNSWYKAKEKILKEEENRYVKNKR